MASAAETLADLASVHTTESALALFDSLRALRAEDMLGRWKGRELATGHPMDGVLAASGWYGKQFDSLEKVHPLLVSANGSLFPMEPRRVRIKLVAGLPRSLVARFGSPTPIEAPEAAPTLRLTAPMFAIPLPAPAAGEFSKAA